MSSLTESFVSLKVAFLCISLPFDGCPTPGTVKGEALVKVEHLCVAVLGVGQDGLRVLHAADDAAFELPLPLVGRSDAYDHLDLCVSHGAVIGGGWGILCR